MRAAYMYSAMVDVAALENDALYREAVERIWDGRGGAKALPHRRDRRPARGRGVRGGVRAAEPDRLRRDLRAVANVYWNQRMFLLSGDAKYVDVLERALYNAAIAGVSLDGDTFFYPNALEADGSYGFNQGALTRKPWFDCSCCPTNLARFIPSLPDYIYATRGDTVYVNLYVASTRPATSAEHGHADADDVYPWDGHVELRVDPGRPRGSSCGSASPAGPVAAPCRAPLPLLDGPGAPAAEGRRRPHAGRSLVRRATRRHADVDPG